MGSILWQEGKRLCTRAAFCFYGICIMAGLLVSYIVSYQTMYYTSNNAYCRGPEAIEELQTHTITKELTILWQESYEQLQQITEDLSMKEDAHGFTIEGFQKLQPYQDIVGIQEMMYDDMGNPSVSFEDVTTLRTLNWRKALSKQGFREDQIETFLGERVSSSIPQFEASTGIRTALSHLPYVLMFLMIFFSITMSSLYAKNRYTHMDVVLLSTKYGRWKDILIRMMAALLYITLLYGAAMLIYTVYAIYVLHMQTSNTPFYLTKESLFSYEAFTYTTAYGKAILMGYIGILGTSSASICISACSKRRELGILLALGFALFPISPLATTLPEAIQIVCSSTLTQAAELFNSLHVHFMLDQFYMESDIRLLSNEILIMLLLGIAIGVEITYAKRKGLRL